jgi:hypothetical protein
MEKLEVHLQEVFTHEGTIYRRRTMSSLLRGWSSPPTWETLSITSGEWIPITYPDGIETLYQKEFANVESRG